MCFWVKKFKELQNGLDIRIECMYIYTRVV